MTHKNISELSKILGCVVDQQFVFALQPKMIKSGSSGLIKRINVLSVRRYTPVRDNGVLIRYIKSAIGVDK